MARRKKHSRQCCLDCGLDTFEAEEYYVLHDELWQRINPQIEGMLCISCAEKRLGRKLNGADFADVPINIVHAERSPVIASRFWARDKNGMDLSDMRGYEI